MVKHDNDSGKADKDVKAAEDEKAEVAEKVEKDQDQPGVWGVETDTTPNENYTVPGVLSGAPVPESSANPAAARREAASGD